MLRVGGGGIPVIFLCRCVFKLCNMDTHPHWLSKQDLFSGSFPFFYFLLSRNFLGLFSYSPFTFLMVRP